MVAKNEIEGFFHCANCMKDKPRNISPRDWSRLEAGWTELGFQVWCKRCEMNIIHVDFEGTQHPVTYGKPEKKPPKHWEEKTMSEERKQVLERVDRQLHLRPIKQSVPATIKIIVPLELDTDVLLGPYYLDEENGVITLTVTVVDKSR
jgi:hypothetical protein